MMVLLVENGNHSPYHWVERCSLAEHFEDYTPGLVDDILSQLLARAFGSSPSLFGTSCPAFGEKILGLLLFL